MVERKVVKRLKVAPSPEIQEKERRRKRRARELGHFDLSSFFSPFSSYGLTKNMSPAEAQGSPSSSFLFLGDLDLEKRLVAVGRCANVHLRDEGIEVDSDNVNPLREGRGGGKQNVLDGDRRIGERDLSYQGHQVSERRSELHEGGRREGREDSLSSGGQLPSFARLTR